MVLWLFVVLNKGFVRKLGGNVVPFGNFWKFFHQGSVLSLSPSMTKLSSFPIAVQFTVLLHGS